MVVRKKRKANASASVKTPEDDTSAETARVGVDTGRIADVLEHKVVSPEKYDCERTIGEAELDNAVIVGTGSVITMDKAELMNDAVTISHNELHGFKSIAAEEQANEEVVPEGGESHGDEEEDCDRPLEFRVDVISKDGVFDENGDKNNDDGVEDDEADTKEEERKDNEAAIEEEDGEDNEAEIEEVDGVEADEDEDKDEDEGEEVEEHDSVYGSDNEDKVENENKEEKVVNDDVHQGNTIKEEVKDDKTKKEEVDSLKERLNKKANAAKDKNTREKLSGGSALADLKSEHKEVQGDQHVAIEKADEEKTKENSGGGSTKQVSNKFIKESKMRTVGGRPETVASEGVTIGEADKAKAKQENGRAGGSSKQKSKKLKKKSRVRSVEGSFKQGASEPEDKPEPGSKKKSVKKVKSMGMIFMCSTKTKDDCYRYKVLGLPASKRESVEKIYKGMRLFLYDVDLKLLYGIYKAAGPGGFNIQPKAFNSQYPSQVRFTILEECLPLAEEKFKNVIRENYYSKKRFETLLTSTQVRDLCKLFLAAGKPVSGDSKKLGRKRRAPISTDRDWSRYRDEDLRGVLNDRRRRLEYSPYRERPVVLPPVRPDSQLPPLPPPPVALPYNYDRALVVDDYRRDRIVEHRDSYRQYAYVQQLDPYNRLPELERRDAYMLQPPLHPEPVISYRGIADSSDSVRRLDPYDPYRELAAYRDPVYSTDVLPERDDYGTVSRPTTSSLPEYRSVRTRYRY